MLDDYYITMVQGRVGTLEHELARLKERFQKNEKVIQSMSTYHEHHRHCDHRCPNRHRDTTSTIEMCRMNVYSHHRNCTSSSPPHSISNHHKITNRRKSPPPPPLSLPCFAGFSSERFHGQSVEEKSQIPKPCSRRIEEENDES